MTLHGRCIRSWCAPYLSAIRSGYTCTICRISGSRRVAPLSLSQTMPDRPLVRCMIAVWFA
nr:MAG TPA: hypothetical protein [Caudoviricetes sp.]